MPRLPRISGREAVRIFERLGWKVARQSGAHIIMTRTGNIATLSIPDHKEVAQGTLRSLIRSADVTVTDFVEAAGR